MLSKAGRISPMYGRFRDATGGISLIYGSLFLKNEAFHTPYLLFRQTGLPYISEKPPDKSVNLPCISEMRAMHIEVMMFCLCRRAGHPCRKRRSKRARRPWRRDVLRRGNRLVQGFPRSVRDCCSEDGFDHMSKPGKRFEPRIDQTAIYDRKYKAYESVLRVTDAGWNTLSVMQNSPTH